MKADQALKVFVDSFVKRVEEMKSGSWEKGWFGSGLGAMPISYETGKPYAGINSFMLLMWCSERSWNKPIFITFNQVKRIEGGNIKKGAKSVPVFFWYKYYLHPDKGAISAQDYTKLNEEERSDWREYSALRSYNVFNVDDTNLEELQSKRLVSLLKKIGSVEHTPDTNGMYENKALDDMLAKQGWLCPIEYDKYSNDAFYNPKRDFIRVPMKGQFNKHQGDTEETYKDGQEYYSTLLHEMAHSTGAKGRLDRLSNDRFGDPKYAKEELVAELTAAVVSSTLGFDKRVTDNSAAYLKGWCSTMKENPKFIVSVMSDVGKASAMIYDVINNKEEEEK